MSLDVANHTDSHRAKLIRDRLKQPPNAVKDTPIRLSHLQGITGYDREKAAREAYLIEVAVKAKAAETARLEFLAKQIAEFRQSQPRDWLRVASPGRETKTPPNFYARIKHFVSKEFLISIKEIDNHRRSPSVVIPRHVCIYLGFELMNFSYPELGRRTGGRDHTTAMHAVDNISRKILTDAWLCQVVHELRDRLELEIEAWRIEV